MNGLTKEQSQHLVGAIINEFRAEVNGVMHVAEQVKSDRWSVSRLTVSEGFRQITNSYVSFEEACVMLGLPRGESGT